jgi:Leucine-rich repeat (LRR) protein
VYNKKDVATTRRVDHDKSPSWTGKFDASILEEAMRKTSLNLLESAAALGGRFARKRMSFPPLAAELLHLPGKPAGVDLSFRLAEVLMIRLIVAIAVLIGASAPVAGSPRDGELTPQQVSAAFKAVVDYGCSHAGYVSKFDVSTKSPTSLLASQSFLPDWPRDAVDVLDPLRGYLHRYGGLTRTSCAVRIPARTTNNDAIKLAASLGLLPRLRSLDFGNSKGVGDAAMPAIRKNLSDLEALFLDGTAIGDEGLKALAQMNGQPREPVPPKKLPQGPKPVGANNAQLRWLDVARTKVTDQGMEQIACFEGLRVLSLADNAAVTDKGIEKLAGLPELSSLNLAGTGVDFASQPDLTAWKNLTVLILSRTPTADAGLKALASLTNLEELDLSGTAVTGPGLAELARLPNLRSVRLTDAPITDEGIKAVAALTHLRVLYLNNSPPVNKKAAGKAALTDTGLEALGTCKALRELNLVYTSIQGAGFKAFAGHACLHHLDLEGSTVAATAFAELRNIPNLRSLNLARTSITGENLDRLDELKYLSRVDLQESKANDGGMGSVRRIKSLRDLNLQGTEVGSAGVKAIADSRMSRLNLANTKVDREALKPLSGMKSLRVLYVSKTPLAASAGQLTAALPECVVVTEAPAKPAAATGAPPPRLPLEP